MKKALMTVAAVALAAAFALPSFAQEAKKADKPKSKQFTGEITAVDVAGKSVTLKKDNETKTVVIGDKTKISAGDKKAAELADLKVGEKVVAHFVEEDGKNVATKIGPPPPPREKKPKAEKAN